MRIADADLLPKGRTRPQALRAAWPLGSIYLSIILTGTASATEPLPVAGRIGPSSGATTLWLDPVTRAPTALLTDPFWRLPAEKRGAVLQTSVQSPTGTGLAQLVVADSLPEYWAQPAVWQPFLKGPAAFSGFGREMCSRDWLGRRSTDRRAHALDPGLKGSSAPSAFEPPGPGALTPGLGRAGLVLSWGGVAGRVYRLQHTAILARGFQDIQTIIPDEDGTLSVGLPLEGAQGFYRVTEIQP